MCCRCCSVRQQKIWAFSTSTLLIILGIVLVTTWPDIARNIILESLPLTPDSIAYRLWVTTPVPVYTSFYLFNWTNPEDLNNPEVKPNFQELGPYTFSDYKTKESLVWKYPEVTFYGRRVFHFLPELSNGTLEDIIVAPHFPTVTASKSSRDQHRIVRKIFNFTLNREGGDIMMRHSAGEWIFDGFYDDLLDFGERLHTPLIPIYSNNFGWFYMRNNTKTIEGNYTIHTGVGNLSQMGELLKWNGSMHTGFYEGECGRVNGSSGELWAPGRKWHDPVSVFMKDAARFINIFPQENRTVNGIDAWLYTSTNQIFDNGQISEDTKCFCVPGSVCPKNGLVDYSPVAFGAPVYMSHPHFYMTDESYRENITGLNPDPTKHGISVLLEPTYGIPLDVTGQLQLSILVERDEAIEQLKDVAFNFYAPLFIMHMRTELSPQLRQGLKFVLNVPYIGQCIGITFICLGTALFIVSLILTKTHKWRGDFKFDKKIRLISEISTNSAHSKEQ